MSTPTMAADGQVTNGEEAGFENWPREKQKRLIAKMQRIVSHQERPAKPKAVAETPPAVRPITLTMHFSGESSLRNFCRMIDAIPGREDAGTVAPQPNRQSKLPFTPRVKTIMELAEEISREWNLDYVGAEGVLLAILREGVSVAYEALKLTSDVDAIRAKLESAMGPKPEKPAAQPAKCYALFPKKRGCEVWVKAPSEAAVRAFMSRVNKYRDEFYVLDKDHDFNSGLDLIIDEAGEVVMTADHASQGGA